MKTERECPHCQKNLGRKALPPRDRELGNAVVKLFGKDATRSDVSLCQSCEKPARLKTSRCNWCWEEFQYYAADWKARKRRWCRSCQRQQSAWNTERHRLLRAFKPEEWDEERTERERREVKELVMKLSPEDLDDFMEALEDGTLEAFLAKPRPKKRR